MTEELSTVVAGLSTPGQFLAFCDETDLTTAPTSTMFGDILRWSRLLGQFGG